MKGVRARERVAVPSKIPEKVGQHAFSAALDPQAWYQMCMCGDNGCRRPHTLGVAVVKGSKDPVFRHLPLAPPLPGFWLKLIE